MSYSTKKVISFSIYGKSRMYIEGGLENIDKIEQYYPNWIPRFYIAENCLGLKAYQKEESKNRCELVIMPSSDHIEGSTTNLLEHHNFTHTNMCWRNLALFDKEIDIVLLRDSDSRCNPREAEAVNQWIESDYPIHAIYDNPGHFNGWGMTGMTGWKRLIIDQIIPGGEKEYNVLLNKFIEWYKNDGYSRGLRFVHFDLHLTQALFISKIGHDRIFKSGMNTSNYLTVSMPMDGSCGDFVGSTVNEKFRNILYSP